MKNRLKKLTVGLFLLAFMDCYSQIQQIVDMSTGINSSNSLIPYGIADDTWQVKLPTGNSYIPIKCSKQTFVTGLPPAPQQFYAPVISNVRLLSPYMDSNFNIDIAPAGTYTYQMTFNHNSCSKTNANMSFTTIGADNYISSIKLNNAIIFSGGPGNLSQDIICNPWSSNKTFNVPIAAINQGVNTIKIEVYNFIGYNNTQTPTGLLIDGKLTINYIPNSGLNPLITTTKTKFCTYDAFTFNGTATVGSGITNSYWEMVESDQNGNVISPGYSYSQWVTGYPSTFTFPKPPVCGKYYKVKLAVQNPCVNWQETNKVIYYSCGPNPNAGPDVNICAGSCATIGTPQTGTDYTYSWSNGVNTAQQTVCPNSTGVIYILTQTETSTGCVNSDQVVVNGFKNDANFSRNTHANPSDNFYTVDCTPIDLNANSVLNFGHMWEVEEVIETSPGSGVFTGQAGTNSSQGINPNPCCWWPLTTNYFGGYTGVANVNCVGTYPNCSSVPNIGQFQLNKSYRIKRTTWNQYCPFDQKAYIVSQTGPINTINGSNQSFTWIEDKNTTDLTYLKNIKTNAYNHVADNFKNISIYPNPANEKVEVQSDETIESISVTSINGSVLIENQNQKEVDLSNLPSGMYFFNIVTENTRKTIKVIKE